MATEQDKLNAEVAKLQAETNRIELEASRARRTSTDWFLDVAKVLGALIAAIGAIAAFLFGTKEAELARNQAKFEVAQAKAEYEENERQAAASEVRLNASRLAADEAEKKLKEAQAAFSALSAELGGVEQSLTNIQASDARSQGVQEVLDKTKQIQETAQYQVSRNEAHSQTAVAPLTGDRQKKMLLLVDDLFSPAPKVRGAAYDALISEFRTEPTLVPALVDKARKNATNLDGTHNVVVTLRDISRTVTVPQRSLIDGFSSQVENIGPKLRDDVTSLRKWLDTRSQ